MRNVILAKSEGAMLPTRRQVQHLYIIFIISIHWNVTWVIQEIIWLPVHCLGSGLHLSQSGPPILKDHIICSSEWFEVTQLWMAYVDILISNDVSSQWWIRCHMQLYGLQCLCCDLNSAATLQQLYLKRCAFGHTLGDLNYL